MSEFEGASPIAATNLLDRLIAWVAMLGGILALVVAALVLVSILGRWLFGAPIPGDFELVKMATAVGVFSYLPYAQAQRGNIMVDTFTGWLPARTNALIDAFWDLVYAAFGAFLVWGLVQGARDSLKNGETLMQIQLVIWPAIAICAALSALLVISCLASARRLLSSNA